MSALGVSGAACDGCSKPKIDVGDAAAMPSVVPDAAPLNVTAIPTASVAKLVNPQNLPAYAGATGSIEGTITVTGPRAKDTPKDFSRCPLAVGIYGKAFREGEPPSGQPEGPRWLADAVVAITGYGSFYVQEKDEAEEVTIKGCGFTKRTVTMTYGQRLDVKNSSREFWTPELYPKMSSVLMMATPGGDAVRLYPKKPGRYELIDHDRKYAVADLYTFLHPLHTTSADGDGKFRIDGIPVGKVKVNSSHPQMPQSADVMKEIEIQQGVVTKVDLTIVHVPAPDAGAGPADSGVYYPPLH